MEETKMHLDCANGGFPFHYLRLLKNIHSFFHKDCAESADNECKYPNSSVLGCTPAESSSVENRWKSERGGAPHGFRRLAATMATLMAVAAFEAKDWFGVIANTYDRVYFPAKAIGVDVAVLADPVCRQFSNKSRN